MKATMNRLNHKNLDFVDSDVPSNLCGGEEERYMAAFEALKLASWDY